MIKSLTLKSSNLDSGEFYKIWQTLQTEKTFEKKNVIIEEYTQHGKINTGTVLVLVIQFVKPICTFLLMSIKAVKV